MNVEQIKAWLLSKGVTLWASWDLSQPERLQEAAEWFLSQQEDLDGWLMSVQQRTTKVLPLSWDVVV